MCVLCTQRDKCVFFFLPMGWMDSSLAKCLSACTCVCVQVCMCLLFLNVSHMWSLLEALTHFLSWLLMSASRTQQNQVSKHICDGSFHTIHPRINHLLWDTKCSVCCSLLISELVAKVTSKHTKLVVKAIVISAYALIMYVFCSSLVNNFDGAPQRPIHGHLLFSVFFPF